MSTEPTWNSLSDETKLAVASWLLTPGESGYGHFPCFRDADPYDVTRALVELALTGVDRRAAAGRILFAIEATVMRDPSSGDLTRLVDEARMIGISTLDELRAYAAGLTPDAGAASGSP